MALIVAKELKKYFVKRTFHGKEVVKAVDNVSFKISKGETFCLIGESGSGKTTLGKLVIGLLKPDYGEVFFENVKVNRLKSREAIKFRLLVQYIPQHPDSALDPRWKIYDSIAEPLRIHKLVDDKREEKQRVLEVIKTVGLKEEHMERYPHELSGGELQRAIIARAIILNPKFIFADEPTSMLDISTQAQILRLLLNIKENFSTTYMLTTHDIEVAAYISDTVAVMYKGRLVEICGKDELLKNPLHPYTQQLVTSIKTFKHTSLKIPTNKPLTKIFSKRFKTDNTVKLNSACPFYDKCPYKNSPCEKFSPQLIEVEYNHLVACHFYS